MQLSPGKTHLPSVAQLLISIFGLVNLAASALVLGFLVFIGNSVAWLDAEADRQLRITAWLALAVSLVTLPSLVYAVRRLARKPQRYASTRWLLLAASVGCLALAPLLYLVYKQPQFFDAPLQRIVISCLAVALPLWWIVELGRYKLKNGSVQRFWGLINFQIFAGLPLVIFFEMALLVVIFAAAGFWIVGQPEFKPLWMTIQTQLMVNPSDFTSVTESMAVLWQKPVVLAGALLSVAVLLPVLEELFKPLALWFFIRQNWTPAEGFSAGLVCGAAFALLESLMAVTFVPADSWLTTLAARLGTGVLHIVTTGLTGWALVSAWREKGYKKLALIYLASTSLHGVWNFFAIFYGGGTSAISFLNPDSILVSAAPWVLGSLVLFMLGLLLLMNCLLVRGQVPPAIPLSSHETMG